MKKKYLWLIILTLLVAIILLCLQFFIMLKEKNKLSLFEEHSAKPIQLTSRKGTYLSLDNVNFRFAEKVPILLKNVNADLIPTGKTNIVNFDDVNSFIISLFKADAYIEATTLEVIFKDYIFNYPDSVLKLETIKFINEKENKIFLNGNLKFIIWLEFELIGVISYNKEKQVIQIKAEEIRAVGTSYAKSLLATVGLDLEKLLPIPEGRGITVKSNYIYIKPFAIFPPPKLEGTILSVDVQGSKLHIAIDNGKSIIVPPKPIPNAKNYLFLFKGDMKFGKLFMVDTYLQMVDKDESDVFDFYLEKYFSVLAKAGSATLGQDKSLKVIMPDYNDTFP